MANTFRYSVVTPERVVSEGEARFVALPAHDGEVGVLKGRAPLVVKLDVGRLRIETGAGTELFYVGGGFAEVVRDRLTVLTEEAKKPDQLDRERARSLLASAREMVVRDDATFAARQRAVKGARLQLRLLDEASHR